MKIMDKLSTYAALLGVIGAIGGGFYTWGQFNSRLDALEAEPPVNLSPLKQKDKELTKQFDEVLLYANEYKVDLIDRINKVEEQIKPTDLTKVFKEIGKIREQIAMLPKPANLQPLLLLLQFYLLNLLCIHLHRVKLHQTVVLILYLFVLKVKD